MCSRRTIRVKFYEAKKIFNLEDHVIGPYVWLVGHGDVWRQVADWRHGKAAQTWDGVQSYANFNQMLIICAHIKTIIDR